MATDTPTSVSAGVVNFATGSFTSDNTATTLTIGFVPRAIKVVNSTDTIVWEKIEGMAAANCTKVTSTTLSVETSSDILINTGVLTTGTVTLSQTLVGSSKAIAWAAWG